MKPSECVGSFVNYKKNADLEEEHRRDIYHSLYIWIDANTKPTF